MAQRQVTRSQHAEMKALFEALDKDRNGYIDKEELRATMSEVGMQLSDIDIENMMKAAGVLIKDRIFYEDFVKMMTGKIGQAQRKAFVNRDRRDLSCQSICDDDADDTELQAMRIAFCLFDKDGDGRISVDEVQDTMTSLGFKIDLPEVQKIVKKVDLDGDGAISFLEFRQAMNRYQMSDAKLSLTSRAEDDELKDSFQIFDKDKDGFLNADDLRSTMQQLGISLSEDDVHAMMKSVGIGPLGKISYRDFCHIYNKKLTASNDKKKDERKEKLSKSQRQELRAVFSVFDKDKDGYITEEEVHEVLLSMGFHPSEKCIQEIFRQVDLDGNSKIDFKEFLLLVKKYERPLPEDVEIREMFKALDKDKNGVIDTEELKESFKELGIPLTESDVTAMLQQARVETKLLRYEDFVKIMATHFGVSDMSVASSDTTEFPSSAMQDLDVEDIDAEDENEDNTTVSSQFAQSSLHDNTSLRSAERSWKQDNTNRVTDRLEVTSTRSSCNPSPQRNLSPANSQRSFESYKVTEQRLEQRLTSSVTHSAVEPTAQTLSSRPARASSSSRDRSKDLNRTKSPVNNAPNTWKSFKVFDRNSDGYISKSELYRTLCDLGIKLSRDQLDHMMTEADINRDGKIDYAEFSKLMNTSFATYGLQAAEKLEERNERVSQSAQSNGSLSSGNNNTRSCSPKRKNSGCVSRSDEEEIRTAFKVFDIDGNGFIEADELRLTMQHLGENLTDRDVEAMIKVVDKNGDGKIDYEEFILMLRAK